MAKITVDPITRIEGHLKVETRVDNGVVKEARSTGILEDFNNRLAGAGHNGGMEA
ncbi:unnamed protein product [marine sediment metagenome]|uniref:Uncharacterized protein n=1 Tax=marine sediment metagenome TaxID=412755 RepID=X1Q1I0_9ZZZZ